MVNIWIFFQITPILYNTTFRTITPKLLHGLGTRISRGGQLFILGAKVISNQVHIFTFQVTIKEINETNKYMMNVKSKSNKSNQNQIEIQSKSNYYQKQNTMSENSVFVLLHAKSV